MHQNGYVVTIRQTGKTLKEESDRVNILFDSEYEIRLRNKNAYEAVAFVYVDGANVTEGGLVVPAHGRVDLERHIKGDLNTGARFRFVRVTDGRVDQGEPDNGKIEVRFHQAKPRPEPIVFPVIPSHHHHYHNHCSPCCQNPRCPTCFPWRRRGVFLTSQALGTVRDASGAKGAFGGGAAFLAQASVNFSPTQKVDIGGQDFDVGAGATVEGGLSQQRFIEKSVDYDKDVCTTIFLKLSGFYASCQAAAERIKSTRLGNDPQLYCSSCGRQRHPAENFCPSCGAKMAA